MLTTRTLIIDDEVEFSQTLAERLTMRGLKVDTAISGTEALEKARKTTFDVVILDLVMPGMDGIETLKRLRAIKPDLQVILLTGHGTIEKSVESLKLGALDFLEKPANLDDLLAKIGEAKDNRLLAIEREQVKSITNIILKKGF